MAALVSWFGCLALAGLLVSGLLLMVAPASGRELVKHIAVAIGLFLLGTTLLQVCCSAFRSYVN
jgi:hypothetical protein